MTPIGQKFSELRKSALLRAEMELSDLIAEYLDGIAHIDRVSVRAKGVKSFEDKALKKNDDGSSKYEDPFNQIQDQIGARIIVFYKADVDVISDLVFKYFKAIEITNKVPEREWEFGYFGKHYILAIPNDVWVDGKRPAEAPEFFELQIKTLFQHAWSEASHDVGYKGVEITGEEKRKLAFTSAQSWGADQIFDELYKSIEARIPLVPKNGEQTCA
jgi:putative GTP pyrophosphokinase